MNLQGMVDSRCLESVHNTSETALWLADQVAARSCVFCAPKVTGQTVKDSSGGTDCLLRAAYLYTRPVMQELCLQGELTSWWPFSAALLERPERQQQWRSTT